MTFYDFFALRTIGRRCRAVSDRGVGSFTSYTIGHNLGATVFTGGAIRFRIYSAWGLGIIDVAKIAFVTGLTFWLGNAFVLGVRHVVRARGRERRQSVAGMDQPRHRDCRGCCSSSAI